MLRTRLRLFARLLAAALVVVAVAACEKPDASDTTSPSARALLGTTTGNVSYAPEGQPPAPADAAGWRFELGNARFSKLENGEAAIQVVTQVQSQAGPGMEIWLSGPQGPVLRWSAGAARKYDGVVCFQLRLEDGTSALPLAAGERYAMTIAFRDPATNTAVISRTVTVAGFPPAAKKAAPGAGSTVARDLLGCPRSVI